VVLRCREGCWSCRDGRSPWGLGFDEKVGAIGRLRRADLLEALATAGEFSVNAFSVSFLVLELAGLAVISR